MTRRTDRLRPIHELRASFGVLTILPVATAPQRRWSTLGFAPVVGAALGGAAAGIVTAGGRLFPGTWGALLTAALALSGLAVITRGLHLDGLADTADGLGPLGSTQTSLAVMRQPDIGPFGVTTLTFVLLADCAALARDITVGRGAASILIAVITGRLAMTQAAVPGIPAARPDGLGARVAQSVPRAAAVSLTALAVVTATSAGALSSSAMSLRLDLALAAGCTAALLLRMHLVHRLSGITGDVLGALNEVATCVCLIATAVR